METSGPMTFPERLVFYRKRLGMTQRNLAKRVGLHYSQLKRIEKARDHAPSVEKMLLIIRELRLPREEAEELMLLAGYSPIALGLAGDHKQILLSLLEKVRQLEQELERLIREEE